MVECTPHAIAEVLLPAPDVCQEHIAYCMQDANNGMYVSFLLPEANSRRAGVEVEGRGRLKQQEANRCVITLYMNNMKSCCIFNLEKCLYLFPCGWTRQPIYFVLVFFTKPKFCKPLSKLMTWHLKASPSWKGEEIAPCFYEWYEFCLCGDKSLLSFSASFTIQIRLLCLHLPGILSSAAFFNSVGLPVILDR